MTDLALATLAVAFSAPITAAIIKLVPSKRAALPHFRREEEIAAIYQHLDDHFLRKEWKETCEAQHTYLNSTLSGIREDLKLLLNERRKGDD